MDISNTLNMIKGLQDMRISGYNNYGVIRNTCDKIDAEFRKVGINPNHLGLNPYWYTPIYQLFRTYFGERILATLNCCQG